MAQLLMARHCRLITAPGCMRCLCRLLLVAVLCCAGCHPGKHKGKKGAAEPAGPVAVGKLIITPPAFEIARGNNYDAGEGFIDQQLDALGGDEIRRKAEEFLKKDHPEIKPASVSIQVARVKGSNVVSVIGRGDSPEYSGALVDAVMEAYVASVRPAEPEKAAAATADSDGAEKALKEAERVWTTFRLEHDVSRLNAELSSVERRQKRLGAAKLFYEEELDLSGKLTLEQDIKRRQNGPGLPSEMPAELAALVRTTLTVAELAYLSALKGANAPVAEAARKEAEKDREERTNSNRKQMDIARDLANAAETEIARLQSLQKESEELQARLRAAQTAYAEKKAREKNLGAGMNDSIHPVVSITERASRAGSR